MVNNKYTENQIQVINGKIPIESMNRHALRWFYEKAVANNDEELAIKIKKQQDVLKEEFRKQKIKKSAERVGKVRRKEEIKWRQPKSNEYTEHQKRIVRGEISYENVHTNELISIHLKARNVGDYELSERILDLITVRREKSIKQARESDNYNKRFRRNTSKYSILFSNDGQYDNLKAIEQAILNGFITIDECLEEHLTHIMKIAKKNNDEEMYTLAEKLLLYKQNPEIAYVTQDHQEAVNLIEALLQLPIRRPDTWFEDE